MNSGDNKDCQQDVDNKNNIITGIYTTQTVDEVESNRLYFSANACLSVAVAWISTSQFENNI